MKADSYDRRVEVGAWKGFVSRSPTGPCSASLLVLNEHVHLHRYTHTHTHTHTHTLTHTHMTCQGLVDTGQKPLQWAGVSGFPKISPCSPHSSHPNTSVSICTEKGGFNRPTVPKLHGNKTAKRQKITDALCNTVCPLSDTRWEYVPALEPLLTLMTFSLTRPQRFLLNMLPKEILWEGIKRTRHWGLVSLTSCCFSPRDSLRGLQRILFISGSPPPTPSMMRHFI